MYSKQRGNILFLILLAVVLFAALSYAVTSNERGQVKSASGESLQTAAAQLVQAGSLIENAVTRMRVTGGCSDTEIAVNSSASPYGYSNPYAPADKHCSLFDAAGGGLSYPPRVLEQFLATNTWSGVNPTVSGWWGPYRGYFMFSGLTDAYPPAGYDLVAYVPFISLQLCQSLQLAINGTSTIPTHLDITYPLSGWGGTYGAMVRSPALNSRSGCVQKTDDGYYSFYQILIAR